MKVSDLIALENEQIENLRKLAINEKNVEAARALLEHLRYVSKNIDDWKKSKEAKEKQTNE